MATLRVRATGSGRVVGWWELKQGRLVDAPRLRWFFFTTALTDVITDLCAFAASIDPDYWITTILPDGVPTTFLDLTLTGAGFEIVCSRRLVRGWLWPFAAEFGSNYDVIVTVNGSPVELELKVLGLLQSRYACELTGRKPQLSAGDVDAASQRFSTRPPEERAEPDDRVIRGGDGVRPMDE